MEGGFETSLGKFVVRYDKTATTEVLEVETPEDTIGTLNWGSFVRGLEIKNGGKWRFTRGSDGKVTGGRVDPRSRSWWGWVWRLPFLDTEL